MLDFLIDLIGDLFSDGADLISDTASTVGDVVSNIDLSDVLLIGSTIYVANLTVSSIKDELHNRQELKAKGAIQVIIKDFTNNKGYTEVSLAALNAQNKQVGTFSMKGRSCSGLYKGQKIVI
ncbi:MAG: hypothetical protein HDS71_08865 [Bacteroidales bacterium]|nr:hypothetical protein [Bacteroidales bacterium]MBD5224135.1 hypothetical protein [Bacteroidales bacterium]